jgi:flavin-dependent thymidylate synthase
VKVTLISYTPDALELLLLTKQTRLTMSPGLLEEVKAWPLERKLAELDYMRGTIQSSWEFVDYTFLIDEVSRAFTHQFVRTRQGSYAQQSQRTVDMSGFEYVATGMLADGYALRSSKLRDGNPGEVPSNIYDKTMQEIDEAYEKLIELGTPPQDARGLLPTNIVTNIVGKFSLRTLSDMAKIRLCTRTQGEYQDVFRAMRERVIEVHPWAEPFIRVHCAALGVCAFPNFMECPIKPGVFNPDTGRRWDNAMESMTIPSIDGFSQHKPPMTRGEIQKLWQITRYEAVPTQGKKT